MKTNTTRRALLGGAGLAAAALIAPVVAALPTTSTPDRVAWDAAFARWTASGIAAKAAGWPDPLNDAYHDNWSALMSTPAPDVRALHWKLHELFSELDPDGYSGSWGGAITAAVLADAVRLADAEGR